MDNPGRLNILVAMMRFKWAGFYRSRIRGRSVFLRHWDDSLSSYAPTGLKIYWEMLGEVTRYQNERISGDPGVDFIQYTRDFIGKNVGTHGLKGLSLGCSEGTEPEMVFSRTGWFAGFDVMDIAAGLLARQEAKARGAGLDRIRYIPVDLNDVRLESGSYDFIWALGTIHHLEKLEHVFREINSALKPGGRFVMREYIGPNRLQFTAEQQAIATRELRRLPLRYRMNWYLLPKTTVRPVGLRSLLKHDPSEAVRSGEIMGICGRTLTPVRTVETGGSLLNPLLHGIAFNFERDAGGRERLRNLIETEKNLLSAGRLSSDYSYCIAGKSPAPPRA